MSAVARLRLPALPLLLLLLLSAATDAVRIIPRPSVRRSALLALRGGAGVDGDTLPASLPPAAAGASDTLPSPEDGSSALAQPTCFSGLVKLWKMLLSLLSPSPLCKRTPPTCYPAASTAGCGEDVPGCAIAPPPRQYGPARWLLWQDPSARGRGSHNLVRGGAVPSPSSLDEAEPSQSRRHRGL